MLGQKPPRKHKNRFVEWLISMGTAILVLGALLGACFLFCTIIFLLNQNAAT